MKIDHLHAVGVKGLTFAHRFTSPVAVIVGPNFSGKTARLEAIRLGLLGHIPELGLKKSSTAAIGTEHGMSVSLGFSDGTANSYRLECKKSSAGKEEFVQNVAVPKVLVAPSEYFSLGPTDQYRLVFGMFGSSLMSPAWVASMILRIKGFLALQPDPSGADLRNQLFDALEAISSSTGCEKFVDSSLEHIASEVRSFKGRLTTATSSAKQRLDDLSVGDSPVDVQPELLEKSQSLGSMKEKLLALRRERSGLVDKISKLNATRTRYDRAVTALEGFDAATAQRDIEAIHAERSDTSNARNGATVSLSASHKRHDLLEREYKTAEASLSEAVADADRLSSLSACPTCWALGDEWKARVAAAAVESHKAMRDNIESARQRLVENSKDMEDMKALIACLDKKIENGRYQERIIAIQDKLEASLKVSSLKATVDQLEASINGVTIQSLDEQQVELSNRVAALESECAVLSEKLKVFSRFQQNLAMLEQHKETASLLERHLDCLRSVTSIIQTAQQEIVDKSFESLLNIANAFSRGILSGPIVYRDGIGIVINGRTVPFVLMSGTERAIISISLSVALAASSPFKLVLLDELSVMSKEVVFAVLERMRELVEKKVIDQFIGALPDSVPTPDGVQVIQLA